jgi:hypothetical protein
MKHKIIQTENYLLVVDDLEIKEGDWLYSMSNQLVVQSNKGSADIINSKVTVDVLYLKIIAHLPLNNSPILDGIDLLPPLEDEDDVEKLADKIYPETYYSGIYVDRWLKAGFIQGYNKAKEKYNKNLIDWIDNISNSIFAFQSTEIELKMLEQFKNKVQSFQQTKIPIEFECDIKKTEGRLMVIPPCKHCIKPKTITNSQGINQWVGKYIFD